MTLSPLRTVRLLCMSSASAACITLADPSGRYHLTSDDTAAGTKQLRKGSEEGPVLATIRSSTDKVDAQITFPTGWSTTIKPGGLYTRKYSACSALCPPMGGPDVPAVDSLHRLRRPRV
jgi:hypothetical protein